jgi:crotonobetainyl-CoA:carnitine CoA-transferase CaiB-like acyl-CoA transferase
MAYDLLSGFKVLELSLYAFAPASAAVLSDWGADVIKIVPPTVADPMMSKKAIGGLPDIEVDIAFMWEQLNRGKRCIGLNVNSDEGRKVMYRLLEQADVFIINLLPSARRRFGLDVEEVQKINPRLIYARASGHGPEGPQKEAGGFDHTDFWARSGVAHAASSVVGEFIPQPGPAFGDVASGAMLAGAIAAALLRRERTGQGAVIDVSLLSTGVWMFGPALIASQVYDVETIPRFKHADQPNPMVTAYDTADGRQIYLAGIQTEKNFEILADILGIPDMPKDPRFATGPARLANRGACIEILDRAFARRTLAQWLEVFDECPVPWAVVQSARETFNDPQVQVNGFMMEVQGDNGTYPLAASPAQFDRQHLSVTRAPQHGENTEEVLMEYGMEWDEIERLKAANVIN